MKANLDWWNEAVGVHAQGNTYGIESFKAGMSKLKYLERAEVGDVAGKSLQQITIRLLPCIRMGLALHLSHQLLLYQERS